MYVLSLLCVHPPSKREHRSFALSSNAKQPPMGGGRKTEEDVQSVAWKAHSEKYLAFGINLHESGDLESLSAFFVFLTIFILYFALCVFYNSRPGKRERKGGRVSGECRSNRHPWLIKMHLFVLTCHSWAAQDAPKNASLLHRAFLLSFFARVCWGKRKKRERGATHFESVWLYVCFLWYKSLA